LVLSHNDHEETIVLIKFVADNVNRFELTSYFGILSADTYNSMHDKYASHLRKCENFHGFRCKLRPLGHKVLARYSLKFFENSAKCPVIGHQQNSIQYLAKNVSHTHDILLILSRNEVRDCKAKIHGSRMHHLLM
jgi:hypothetical protein